MAELSMATFTDTVIGAIGPGATPRVRTVMTALIRHLHDFAREVKLTTPEYRAACDFIVRIGRMSDDKRNEAVLASDVFGLESLVDVLDHHNAERGAATDSAVLGPFWREHSPLLDHGASIVRGGQDGESVFVCGRVLGVNGRPVGNARIAVWETAPNGLYEQQDPEQPDFNLRGQFCTDAEGRYAFRALRPIAYPIPFDGPAGELLQMMDRHPFRPAHIHFRVRAPGYHELVTQIFDRDDRYLASDSVFAVKDSLTVEFRPAPAGADTRWHVDFDIVLEPLAG